MKAIVANAYGTPEVFEYKTVEKPSPKTNEVLVKVMNSAATTADSMVRTGKPYLGRLLLGLSKPKQEIPGTGFSGIVEEVGTSVSKFKVGDRVFGETKFGFKSNAEFICIHEEEVIVNLPDSIDFSEASNFCDGHLTSYSFLTKLIELKKGDHILINGASGALGTAAVQLAKFYGAEVTTVSSAKNMGLLKTLGADHLINYHEQDFTSSENQYDYVFDTVGKSNFKKAKNVLKDGGAYLSPVMTFNLFKHQLWSKISGNKKALFTAVGTHKNEDIKSSLNELLNIYKAGKLKTVIDRQFPLAKLAEAHQYIDSGHKTGNIVIFH